MSNDLQEEELVVRRAVAGRRWRKEKGAEGVVERLLDLLKTADQDEPWVNAGVDFLVDLSCDMPTPAQLLDILAREEVREALGLSKDAPIDVQFWMEWAGKALRANYGQRII
jgi:hypothetical protein